MMKKLSTNLSFKTGQFIEYQKKKNKNRWNDERKMWKLPIGITSNNIKKQQKKGIFERKRFIDENLKDSQRSGKDILNNDIIVEIRSRNANLDLKSTTFFFFWFLNFFTPLRDFSGY